MALHIPEHLSTTCRQRPEWTTWLSGLPEAVEEILERWSLTLCSVFDQGASCAWVASVNGFDGTSAILKLGLPHMEAQDEANGLRFWNGDPTATLLASDDSLGAMLLERCEPGTSLRLLPESDQHPVIAALLRRLWRKPPTADSFRPLSTLMDYWAAETLADIESWIDPVLVREGLRLFAELPSAASDEVVLATDLHAGNILRAQREPWLVIDPKPFFGDPAYDLTQHIFNCPATLRSDPHGFIHHLADLAGTDPERVLLWTFARAAAEPRDDWRNSDLTTIARTIKT